MRRVFGTVVAIVMILATPQIANAALKDRVTGGGSTGSGYSARVNAQSGAQGQPPRGTFSLSVLEVGDRLVHVTCMTVVGNTATIGGIDRRTSESFLLTVQDNGETGDLSTLTFGFLGVEPDQARCNLTHTHAFAFAPVEGDYTVEDS